MLPFLALWPVSVTILEYNNLMVTILSLLTYMLPFRYTVYACVTFIL